MDGTRAGGEVRRTIHAAWRRRVRPRVDRAERLDLGEGSLADAAASLEDMWRINRYLGGFSAITTHLYPRLRSHRGTATILDLGTGSAHLPVAVAQWAAQNGHSVHIYAADRSARHLTIAQSIISSQANVNLIQTDALSLPYARGGVDYVIASLVLHHFTPENVIIFLREAFACARHAVIISDVTRGLLPLIGFKLCQPIFARSYLTRYDGAVSIERAYTPDELRDLAAQAGLTGVRVTEHPLWRMTLTADKP